MFFRVPFLRRIRSCIEMIGTGREFSLTVTLLEKADEKSIAGDDVKISIVLSGILKCL